MEIDIDRARAPGATGMAALRGMHRRSFSPAWALPKRYSQKLHMPPPQQPLLKKSKQQLLDSLAEHVSLLMDYCTAFDAGKQHYAKPMSASLQMLLYGVKGNSLCLLHQLGMRAERFFDTAPALPPSGYLGQCQLAAIRVDMDNLSAHYIPMLSTTDRKELVPFSAWWNTPVVRDVKGRTFSRLEIVKEVRDKDGGAHVDGDLVEAYADFASGRYSGWQIRHDGEAKPIPNPHLACVRQIAHETLLSLERFTPQSFQNAYAYPTSLPYEHNYADIFNVAIGGLPPGKWYPAFKFGEVELIAGG